MVTGLRPETFKRLQLNAGVFLIDFAYDKIADKAELAAAIQKARADGAGMLGATRGGGTFSCTPDVREIEADGKRNAFIGSTVFDGWTVKMTGTLLEVGAGDNLARLIGTAEKTTEGGKTTIRVRNDLAASDYIKNLVWVGDTSEGFVLISLENVLNTTGLSMTFSDKGEGTLPFEFTAHQASVEDTGYAPCEIIYFTA